VRLTPPKPNAFPPRLVGRVAGIEPGPTLLVVAGLHGNEPAGLLAARRVFDRLRDEAIPVRGDFAVVAGNRGALDARRRYLLRDMNRGWSVERLEALRRPAPDVPAPGEDAEQLELEAVLKEILADSRGRNYFIDLHTTSADGFPFAMIRDTPEQRRFAAGFELPVILGLLERIDGVLLGYMEELGCLCLGVEGGGHDRANSVDHHEAVLWIALAGTGAVSADRIPGLEGFRAILRKARGDLPPMMKVTHRHEIRPGDDFRMEPGFANIHPVNAGDLLARDRHGEIRARETALVLLPLYQGLGDDGFFLGSVVAGSND
jgi:predicted deacylase